MGNGESIMTTVMEDWRKPDKGIWEIRGEGQHFVSSKVMCWVALDRGARIARILNKYENSRRWEEEADAIKADVMRNGWKEEIQSFSQAYGNLDLDSSLLLMEPYGFIDADDIRYHKTVKAVKQSLLHKGLMYRYNTHDDFGCPSSAFTICTFWLIRALYVIGEKTKHAVCSMKFCNIQTIWVCSVKILISKQKNNWVISHKLILIWHW